MNLEELSARHQAILDILQLQGSVSVAALAERLDVSEVTIRKDLTLLEEQKRLYRSHGRAVMLSPYISKLPQHENEGQAVAEKRAIGKAAAAMVREHDSILLTAGTTILYTAKELADVKNITVISASVSASSMLSQSKDIEVIQLGGQIREKSVSAVGSYCERMLSLFSCDLLFMGADAIDLDFGVTISSLDEASRDRRMMDAAKKTVLLADSSKFGRKGFSKICDCNRIDQVITDEKIPQDILTALRELGIEVTLVKA